MIYTNDPNELDAVKTPLTAQDVYAALGLAWRRYFSSEPVHQGLLVLIAQWAFENAWGKACFNWNLGNQRLSDGLFCLRNCGEDLPPAMAAKLHATDPGHITVGPEHINSNGATVCSCTFTPPNQMCRFSAYPSAEDGAYAYFRMMVKRFSGAWPSVLHGDPVGFVHACKVAGYFTGDEAAYSAGVRSIFADLARKLPAPEGSEPVMSDDEREENLRRVALALQVDVDEGMKNG